MFYDNTIWLYISVGMLIFWLVYYFIKRIKCNFFAFFYFSILPYVLQQRSYNRECFRYLLAPLCMCIIMSLVFEVAIRNEKLYFSNVIKPYLCFAIYVVVSGLLIGGNNNFYIGIRNLAFFSISMFSLYFLIGENKEEIKRAAQINVIILFACALLDTAIFFSVYGYVYRASGPLIGMNECAQMALLYLYFSLSDSEKYNKTDCLLILITLGTVLLTGSNGGLIAIMIWIIVSAYMFKPVKKHIVRMIIIFLVFGMATILAIRIFQPILFSNLFASQSDRIMLWSIFLNVFKTSPIWGHGYNMVNSIAYQYIYDMGAVGDTYSAFLGNVRVGAQTLAAHNDFVKLLSETGLLGTLLFGMLIYAVFKICMRLPKKNQTLFISFVIFFSVHNILQDSRVWMFLFAITVYSQRSELKYCGERIAVKVVGT